MADDLKKTLVQYGDKVLFGLFVVVLVATAAFTVLGTKSDSDREVPPLNGSPKAEETVAERIAQLTTQLARGGIPEDFITGGFATDQNEITPRKGEVACEYCGWIMPEKILRCPSCRKWRKNDDDKDGMPNDWEDRYTKFDSPDRHKPDAEKDPDNDGFTNLKEYIGGSNPEDPKSIPSPFRITNMERRVIDVRFQGFTIKEGGSGEVIDPDYWVMQINYGRNTETEFVPLGGHFRGYRLFPLETTKALRKGRGGIPDWYEDVYVLTIQRRGQDAIQLEKAKWGKTNETYVNLLVTRGKDSGKVYRGRTVGDGIVANGQRFEFIEMRGSKAILKGSEGEIYTLY